MNRPPALPLLAAAALCLGAVAPAAGSAAPQRVLPDLAQTQIWQRRGAPPPADAQVEPENCATASDGSITCGTRLEGSGRRGPAAPRLDPFPN